MHCLTRKSVGLFAPAAVAAVAFILPGAGVAQEVPPTSTSTPSASQGTLPGVVPERFTLAPPRPTPAPTPELSPTPTPAAAFTPPPRASAAPSATKRLARERVEPSEPLLERGAEPPTVVVPTVVPVVTPPPQAVSTPPVTVTPASEGAPSWKVPGWLWALAGGGVLALSVAAYRLLRRGRDAQGDATIVELPATIEPLEAPQMASDHVSLEPRPAAPAFAAPTRKREVPIQPPQPIAEPFEVILRPLRLAILAEEVALELELLLGNRQPEAAENVRVQLTMLSANPEQDRYAASFHAATMLGEGVVAPFDLASGVSGRIPVRLSLSRQALHVVHLAGRPMFVPMVLVDLRWRAGISIRRFGADFLAGTQGQGEKLGPVWLDRPVKTGLAATRYLSKSAVAA